MANPRPTYFTTGNFETRDHLRTAVVSMRRVGGDWEAIGRACGVSARTAKRCHEEEQAIRKEARARAYELAQVGAGAPAPAPPVTGLSQAAMIYALLMIAAIVGITAFVTLR